MMKFSIKLFLLFAFYLQVSLNAQEQITEASSFDEDFYVDDIVPKRIITENRLLSYMPIREADIVWQKKMWRIIDTREKINLVFRAEQAPFFDIIKGLIENGDITAFEDEKFKEPLTFEQVEGKLFKIDTITTFDFDTYDEKLEIVKNTKSWRDINKYRIKEIWYFDKQTSTLRNKIIGIAPLFTEVDPNAGYTLEYPLFWIYYPEARVSLARYQVLNDENDAAPMTWADRIDNRYFSSIIVKQSNVLDFRIEDLFDSQSPMYGIDKLLESEKIKNELFNFEHDLWEY